MIQHTTLVFYHNHIPRRIVETKMPLSWKVLAARVVFRLQRDACPGTLARGALQLRCTVRLAGLTGQEAVS